MGAAAGALGGVLGRAAEWVSEAPTPSSTSFDGKELVDGRKEHKLSPPVFAIILSFCWFVPVILYYLVDRLARKPQRMVVEGEQATASAGPAKAKQRIVVDDTVLCASLEHSLPHLLKAKAVAGGLGKVMDLVARHHPTNIIMVHPMIQQSDKVDYGPRDEMTEEVPLRILVDGRTEEVRVLRQTSWPTGPVGPRVEFLLLSHSMFEARTKDSIYPSPMSRRAVLGFFSLWNQAVGALLVRYKPAVFHCPDFHTAVAPWYAYPFFPTLRVLLVLHNAEYQGTISTDMITGHKVDTMAKIWNLPPEKVIKHLTHDGRFNMLKAATSFVMEHQGGKGVCAVSQYYAAEAHNQYALLWSLPTIDGLDNPMLEEERAVLTESLGVTKAKAKEEIQRSFRLKVDPEARIFVSLGRLVRQKGVDLLADIAPWLLANFDKAQLVLIGPIGDGYGHYAANKLRTLMADPRFEGRIFVRCEFMRVSDSLKFGADYCLMPSRDEPFGYVDIEFAWRGAVVVGAQAGGLGKVPGFYYLAQNRENMERLREEIQVVIQQAMEVPAEQLEQMARKAMECSFPLLEWQRKLMHLYDQIIPDQPQNLSGGDLELQTLPNGPGESFAVDSAARAVSAPSGLLEVAGSDTFLPYDTRALAHRPSLGDPTRTNLERAALSSPVNLIDTGMAKQVSYVGNFTGAIPKREFLTQELSEEEIAERVQDKLAMGGYTGIDDIIESIGSDVDMERAEGAVAKWLLKSTWGVKHIHVCVSCGYIFTPVAAFLTFVASTEWGMRGGALLPEYFKRYAWYTKLFSGGVDPPVMNILLFTTNSLAATIGTPVWARLSRTREPRQILGFCLLMQLPLLGTVLPVRPTVFLALLCVFVQGFISSAGLIFVVFNFMMAIKADLSHAALRMGCLEMLRYCTTWLFTGYMFIASPSALAGDEENPMPKRLSWIFIPVAAVVLCTTVIPGVLCLYAPGPYRDDRSPGWDLGLLSKRTSFLLLSLSDCVGAVALYPGTAYVQWWLANGWTSQGLGWLSAMFGFFLAAGAGIWFYFLSKALKHGMSALVGTALLVAPPALLRAIVHEEVSTFTFWGSSVTAMVICIFSLLVEGIRSSAMWTVKIRVLNSRWRLLSYATIFITATNFLGACSPWICEWIARRYGATFISGNQKELADAMVVTLAPFGVAQFALQICTLPFISAELGATAQEFRGEKGCAQRLLRRSPVAAALLTGAGLGIAVYFGQHRLIGKDMVFTQINRCSNVQIPQCWVITDVTDPAMPTRTASGFSWGLGRNEFHMETTARFNCHRVLRVSEKGDTMVFWPDGARCQVLRCGGPSALHEIAAKGEPEKDVEVWSYHCSMPGKNLVGVQLFEWQWEDISKECTDYLGPAGYDFVHITPPQEHPPGDVWWVRYRPVSFQLESRSGTTKQFQQMVQDCKKAGVHIMVDTILNHMASARIVVPKHQRNWECSAPVDDVARNKTAMRCRGWAETEYGNRAFGHAGGSGPQDYSLDQMSFHHHAGNQWSNCAVPPWTNNRYLCDLFSLPDLNTEKPEVQKVLGGYLADLYHMGVTMLRIDAAAHIYPSSLASLLEPFPWDYAAQEIYPHVMQAEPETLRKAKKISAITDFQFGQRVAQIFFDAWNPRADDGANWTDRSRNFGELLHFGQKFRPSPLKSAPQRCPYRMCESTLEPQKAFVFLDNHDTQRHRIAHNGDHEPVCYFDGSGIDDCRPFYKMGREYHQASLWMLAYPYGDATRIMSSYAFWDFETGPPFVRENFRQDTAYPVHQGDRVTCKDTPTTSPVTRKWEEDRKSPWVCEHRWTGMAGLVRLRKLIGRTHRRVWPRYWDEEGHIAFSYGPNESKSDAFVALNREGYNWYTNMGSDNEWNMTQVNWPLQTGLLQDLYCDLARMTLRQIIAFDSAIRDRWECPDEAVVSVGEDGIVASGTVPPRGLVAIHRYYSKTQITKKCQAKCIERGGLEPEFDPTRCLNNCTHQDEVLDATTTITTTETAGAEKEAMRLAREPAMADPSVT